MAASGSTPGWVRPLIDGAQVCATPDEIGWSELLALYLHDPATHDQENQMRTILSVFLVLHLLAAPSYAQSNMAGGNLISSARVPSSVANFGYFFVGGSEIENTREQRDGRFSAAAAQGHIFSGQMYVEFWIPQNRTHAYPVVMISGRAQTGTNFTGTPDGRPGWLHYFLARGYAVYVVDKPGHGRSTPRDDVYGAYSRFTDELIESRFTAPEIAQLWPQAHLHTQWPGSGRRGDPIFEQFVASQGDALASDAVMENLMRAAGSALLDKIGPAILLTHSQGGEFGWVIADARPTLVKAILAVEPNGPPFHEVSFVGAPSFFKAGALSKAWGATYTKVGFEPPVDEPGDIKIEQQANVDSQDIVRCWLQSDPVHRMINLVDVPVAVVTSEASFRATVDHCTVAFLKQAGVHVEHIELAKVQITGNGHMMMLEKNNGSIANLMIDWLDKAIQ